MPRSTRNCAVRPFAVIHGLTPHSLTANSICATTRKLFAFSSGNEAESRFPLPDYRGPGSSPRHSFPLHKDDGTMLGLRILLPFALALGAFALLQPLAALADPATTEK